MRTATTQRILPYVVVVVPLALSVVLPPKYLAAYLLVLGVIGGAWGLFYRRGLLLRPSTLAVMLPLALAGIFCLMGTLPIRQQSDIQLEFLKYAIYAAAFLLGLLALGNDWRRRAFILTVVAIIYVFFVASALTSGQRFAIDQSWYLYSPDQNNTSSILAPFAVFVLAFRPRWLKIAVFLLLLLFFMFAESRFGIILLFVIAAADLLLDWRSGLTVLILGGVIVGLFSLSNVSVQTTVMRAIASISAPAPQGSVEAVTPQQEPSPAVPATAQVGAPTVGVDPATPAAQSSAQPLPERVSTEPIIQFGTLSDNARLQIYARALEISAKSFPNLIGMGDAQVITLLNTPPIDSRNTFQHVHNFFLQGYLAYGLLATLALVAAAIGMFALAIQRRDWHLASALILIGAYGMIESLISDLRVLAVIMLLLGSSVATTIGADHEKRDP